MFVIYQRSWFTNIRDLRTFMIYERSWSTNVRDLRTFVIYECSWFTDVRDIMNVRDSWTTRRSWAARSVKPVIQLIIAAFVFCIVISPMEVVWDLMLKVANFFFWQQPQRRRCPVEQRGTLVHLFVCLLVCSFVRASAISPFFCQFPMWILFFPSLSLHMCDVIEPSLSCTRCVLVIVIVRGQR